jgi:transcriptional regulator with XRE-family HTH domain
MQPSEARILELLDALIGMRKFGIRDMERRLGMSVGTLRRILNGRIELKFRHITDILEVLDIPARTFFKVAFETDPVEVESLLSSAQRLTAEPKTLSLTREDLEAVVVAAVERLGFSLPPLPPPIPPSAGGKVPARKGPKASSLKGSRKAGGKAPRKGGRKTPTKDRKDEKDENREN